MTEAPIEAVLKHPDEDWPRKIYADWLDEQGQCERAEFIRVQCRLAELPCKMPMGPPGEDYPCDGFCENCLSAKPLRRRERELLDANFGAWTNDLPEPLVTRQCPGCEDGVADYETNVIECRQCDCTGLVPDQDNVEFRRGFVAAVTCTAEDWLVHGDAIVAVQPIEEVRLTTWPATENTEPGRHIFSGSCPEREAIPITYACPTDARGDLERRLLHLTWDRVKTWVLPPATTPPRHANCRCDVALVVPQRIPIEGPIK